MGRRIGTCAHCGRRRTLRRDACGKCRAGERREQRAEAAAEVGEAALETGVLGMLGRGLRAVLRALTD